MSEGKTKYVDTNVWQSVLGEIELNVSRASFATWFKHTELLSEDSGLVRIGVPNIFAKQQLEVKFSQQIRDTLVKQGVVVNRIEYRVLSANNKQKSSPTSRTIDITKPVQRTGVSVKTNNLNDKYQFDSFIVGSSNELAYAACQAVVMNPGTKFNPLFIYGGVGLGKTHLIQAVGHGILNQRPGSKIIYISSETFVNEFLDAIRFKKKGFADKYRDADVLIVDDIQFIAGKEKTQEGFFHTFNALHQANKQIIISSDKPPKSIPTLEDRLRSRFEWGMTVDIQPPDLETRQVILQTKATQHHVKLADEVIEYIANNVQTNIRELEGALNQLLVVCEMRGLPPDLQTAKGLIGGLKSRPRHITSKQIVDRVCNYFQLKQEDITGPKRDKDIVLPRQIAMYLLRSELHMSYPKIAHELGRKDHTTAIHSIDKIEQGVLVNYSIRQYVSDLREEIYV